MDNRPVVQIKDCTLQRTVLWNEGGFKQAYVLIGTPIDYPAEHMAFPGCVSNRKPVQTSEVIDADETTVLTKRTEYRVKNWLTKPDFQTTLAAHFGKSGLTQS